MNSIAEVLWQRISAILGLFADRLTEADPALIREIGRTANDAFILRGYLALRRNASGTEISITIDIRKDDTQLTIESDACSDDGAVIAEGPSAVLLLAGTRPRLEVEIDLWFDRFEKFLISNEQAVAAAASELA